MPSSAQGHIAFRADEGIRAPRQRAFTLIELILVMGLMVVLISAIAPSLANFFRGRALDSEARRLMALAHAGQSRAVSDGMPMLLWVDAQQRTYGLEQETTSANGDPKAMEFPLDDTVRIVAANASPMRVRDQKLPAIRFLPDGTVDEASPESLRLEASDGSSLILVQATNRLSYEIQIGAQ